MTTKVPQVQENHTQPSLCTPFPQELRPQETKEDVGAGFTWNWVWALVILLAL